MKLVNGAFQEPFYHRSAIIAGRKSEDREGCKRRSAHCKHITDRVGSTDASKYVGIINDRRNDVNGFHHERAFVPEDSGIISGTYNDTPVLAFVHIRKDFRQVRRTQFRRSAACFYFFRKSNIFHNGLSY